MWKKDDGPDPTPYTPQTERQPTRTEPGLPPSATGERATIGRSITIRGDVSGDEDLLIQGRVDGSVNLKDQTVTVGREGRVKADITGRVVTVEGEVEGNLKADEQVIVRSTANVKGDIAAPRVVLEDGGTFRGGIDMGEPETMSKRNTDVPLVAEKKASVLAPASTESSKTGEPKKDPATATSKASI